MAEPGLYVVATPIGNLSDITIRALEVLGEVNVIAAEDKRVTRVLLERHGISTPLVAVHEHNEEREAAGLVERIRAGEAIALVSDAGTPLISDPGYRLVKAVTEAELDVFTIPGASAVTAALSISGLPTDRFVFEGFLPARAEARRQKLEAAAGEARTLVFFESSHRITDTLADMADKFGPDRRVAMCRELTKKFETTRHDRLCDLVPWVLNDANQQRGEFVLVVEGNSRPPEAALSDAIELARTLSDHLSASKAAKVAAAIHDVPRRDVYAGLGAGDG